MDFVFETNRLILREFELSDDVNLFNLNSNPLVIKYTGDIPFKSTKHVRTFIQNYTDYKKYGFGRWAVIYKESNLFLGWCGLKQHPEGFVDIGFRFFQAEWGKGYATEAALETLNYAFNMLELDEVIGRAASDNPASIRVLEKINMTYWKTESCDGIENARIFRITKGDFLKNHRKEIELEQ